MSLDDFEDLLRVFRLAAIDDLSKGFAAVSEAHFGTNKVILVRDYLVNLTLFRIQSRVKVLGVIDLLLLINEILKINKLLYNILLTQILLQLHQILINLFKDQFILSLNLL